MKLVGVILIITGLVFGVVVVWIIATRSQVSYLLVIWGPLIAAAEIVVGYLMLVNSDRWR
jgi:hypothetical protein